MELTKEEIQKVEHYLNIKHITYIDLRVEVLDHIVSEIEDAMRKEKITFHYAFATAKQKWNPQLKETTSMFFGLGFSAPKIVIQKAKKVYWKQYVFLLASYFIPFLLLTHFNFTIENPTEYSFFTLFKGVVIFSFLAFIYMLVFRNYKIETTYGFILKAQSLGAFTGLIVLAVFFTRLKELNGINIGMLCSYIYMTISYFHFYKKHQEAIKKYKIS
ncbi:hypothetical protein QWY81_02660 [Polaribacter undariae]|uniref:Uncharacterized protein n=1 Tax=Polaribacter sejongensis TaxID=985043 RepID=A0AAJ1QUK0_9FLAO|nr:hypothetical protein [Polaribacter undariae]MDN3618355.1 hypothetical protein [Polaribacter undariae]UWD30660.1 hypothetical protein NQP51_10975 [Polaribacter undariae]